MWLGHPYEQTYSNQDIPTMTNHPERDRVDKYAKVIHHPKGTYVCPF